MITAQVLSWHEPKLAYVMNMAEAHFEVFKDASGQFRFRLRAPNGEPIASSEGYTTKEACMDGIKSVQKNAPKAKVKDITA
jgi:uncharacterized protein YegP (UPF0339 family)